MEGKAAKSATTSGDRSLWRSRARQSVFKVATQVEEEYPTAVLPDRRLDDDERQDVVVTHSNTLAWVMQNGESHVRNWYTGCKQCS